MLKVFVVRDKAVDSFMSPFFCRATGEGIRVFSDAVNDKQSPFYAHPGDYELYALGEFDPVTGLFTSAVPVLVVSASQVVVSV